MKIPQGKFFAGFLRSGFHLTAKFLGPAGARPAAGHLACHGRAEAQRDNPGAYAHSQPQRNYFMMQPAMQQKSPPARTLILFKGFI
ncbi:MAG: hypothetical protein M1489_02170 [Firmicutes bacterium]|nr:hypothetical protein [Bacillota bacterium]